MPVSKMQKLGITSGEEALGKLLISDTEDKLMATTDTTDQILWMADCYSLAKRFPNPHTWLALLEPQDSNDVERINPFHYWLWMEIWKAAQTSQAPSVSAK